MTTETKNTIDQADQWAADYMAHEGRRNALIGVAVLIVATLATLGILYYFGSLATTGW
ncbi:MAG: hypothetical protein ACLFVJ_09645 [Persicimonas sp.]